MVKPVSPVSPVGWASVQNGRSLVGVLTVYVLLDLYYTYVGQRLITLLGQQT